MTDPVLTTLHFLIILFEKHAVENQRPKRVRLVREFVSSFVARSKKSDGESSMFDVSTKGEGFFEMGLNRNSESKVKFVHMASDRSYEDEDSFERLSNVASDD
ncbi:hypothetical protein PIB30_016143 [Stylosanthes scabra]|uniref:Uncharacterized protein n=1 Tax=Stylosanthes scabra TaxID=79078 RepID=A0ABU6S6Y9_9FABA|nr:hypothetical protein [Stylosanthes scabra]